MSFAFLFDASNAGTADYGSSNAVSAWMLNVGSIAFSLMLPILAGYIAYSIADRPGILPGIVVGMIAHSDGSGFIGAIIGGLVAGYIILFVKKSSLQTFQEHLKGQNRLLFSRSSACCFQHLL